MLSLRFHSSTLLILKWEKRKFERKEMAWIMKIKWHFARDSKHELRHDECRWARSALGTSIWNFILHIIEVSAAWTIDRFHKKSKINSWFPYRSFFTWPILPPFFIRPICKFILCSSKMTKVTVIYSRSRMKWKFPIFFSSAICQSLRIIVSK